MSYYDGKLYLKEDIPSLKRKMKNIYIKYSEKRDEFSCGASLAEYISPELDLLKKEFNQLAELLKGLDPTCPKTLKL